MKKKIVFDTELGYYVSKGDNMNQKVVLKSNSPEVITRFQLLAQELNVGFHVEPEESNVVQLHQPVAKVSTVADAEKELILKALENHRGNMSKTSKSLGIGRATLYRKIKSYNIEVKVKSA
jgi:transcriptional regulator of acetoin/glycerol metabolism